jgi:hypothetical protein
VPAERHCGTGLSLACDSSSTARAERLAPGYAHGCGVRPSSIGHGAKPGDGINTDTEKERLDHIVT